MRPRRGCKKPRLEASSDEEDEGEREKLKELAQKLRCSKTEKSVEEEKRQKARAQIKFDSSAKKQQRSGSEEGIRQSRSIQPVKFDNGFVSSLRYGPIGHQSYASSFLG